jgi:hemoglobin-like flavoprotein
MGNIVPKTKITPIIGQKESHIQTSFKTEVNLPSYYSELTVNHKDYIQANISWKSIVEGTCKHYIHLKRSKKITENTCITWFYKILYHRLFHILPEVESMFKRDIHKQGKMMVTMITDMLESYYNPKILDVMRDLTISHIKYGVHSYHFIIMGDALFYALDRVLGDDFTNDCANAWKKIYSSILRVIIPIYNQKEENRIINNLIADCRVSQKDEDMVDFSYKNNMATDHTEEPMLG